MPPMSLFWRRVDLSTALPAEEVQERLATAMSEWGCDFGGRSPPPLPWPGGRFLACTSSGWRPYTNLVVEGAVLLKGGSTRLTAVIRPHGLRLTSPFLLSAVMLAVAASDTRLAGPLLIALALVWALGSLLLWLHVSRRAPEVVEVLEAACQVPDARGPRTGNAGP